MDQNNIPANHSNTTDDEIDLRELILTLVKGWKIILACTVVVAVLAAVYAYRLPDQYVVITKAATVGGGSSNSQMAGLAALAGVNIGGGEKEVDLLEHLDVVIKNSHFMDALLSENWPIIHDGKIDTMTLAEYWKIDKPNTSVGDSDYAYKMSLYSRLRSIKKKYITIEKKQSVVAIKTQFTNPALSYGVHNKLMILLSNYIKDSYANRDRNKRIFIEERLAEVENELVYAEIKMMKFLQKNITLMVPEEKRDMPVSPRIALEFQRLKRTVEQTTQIYSELLKQYEIAKIDEKRETPVFEILQKAELPLVPSAPNRKLYISIGAVLGFFLGAGIFLLRKFL